MTREEKIKLAIESGFTYDPETGIIISRFGNQPIQTNKGYLSIRLNKNKKRYYLMAHHFAWYIYYNKINDNIIDHINGIRNDNRIINLRDVSAQKNCWNRKSKGYSFIDGKWMSKIVKDGKSTYLGLFDTEEEARQSYLDAKKVYHII